MNAILDFFKWVAENWQMLAVAIVSLMTAVLGVLRMIPGEQGEDLIDKIVEFLKKITKNNGDALK